MINYICMSKPGTIIIRSINRAFVNRLRDHYILARIKIVPLL